MIVTAREYTSAAEMKAAAAATHARLMKPKNRVVQPEPAEPPKVIPFMARKLPEWQARPTMFDHHVSSSRQILALIRSGEFETAPSGNITIARVVGDVLASFPDVSSQGVKSSSRAKLLCLPRAICMYEARVRTGKSYPEIGRWFGGRDHTTVIAAVQKIERMIVDGCVDANGILFRVTRAEA